MTHNPDDRPSSSDAMTAQKTAKRIIDSMGRALNYKDEDFIYLVDVIKAAQQAAREDAVNEMLLKCASHAKESYCPICERSRKFAREEERKIQFARMVEACKEVRLEEREACAKLIENHREWCIGNDDSCDLAEDIRARSLPEKGL